MTVVQFYENVGKANGTRDPLDVYETPGYVTRILLEHVDLDGPVLEPAEGSGRISRILRDTGLGLEVVGQDIRTGHDFMAYEGPWEGDIVTNPPYRDGLAQAFTEHALAVAEGRVAMLLKSGFLWADCRRKLFWQNPPELILIIPDRVLFVQRDGTPISGQVHSHEWLVWPKREDRGPDVTTRMEWSRDLRELEI